MIVRFVYPQNGFVDHSLPAAPREGETVRSYDAPGQAFDGPMLHWVRGVVWDLGHGDVDVEVHLTSERPKGKR